MGYRELSLKLPTDYIEEQLRERLKKELKIREFTYQIENKSLDARKKNNIHWLVRVGILSKEIKEGEPVRSLSLNIPYRKREERAVVVGSGPFGIRTISHADWKRGRVPNKKLCHRLPG